MWKVLPSPFHSLRSDFAAVISRKFKRGRFLVVGAHPEKLATQFDETGREAVIAEYPADLAEKLREDAAKTRFEVAVWFYSSEKSDDACIAEELSRRADEIVVIPGAGADVAERRLQLIERFLRFGLLPDYECDLSELHLGALRLQREPVGSADELIPAVEAAFARLNTQLKALQRIFQIRGAELEAAHRHIAAMEEKLLKLKEYRRELKLLKEQRQRLRKSPERRVGQVLLSPYRLPEKFLKTIWKKLHSRDATSRPRLASTEYQEWFDRHRASASDLDQMQREARAFAFQPLVSIITPVFDTPVQRLEEAVGSVI